MVIDHGSFAVSETEGDHTLIAADDFIQSDVLLGSTKIEVSDSNPSFNAFGVVSLFSLLHIKK